MNRRIALGAALALSIALPLAAQSSEQLASALLARLDQSAATFKTAQANMRRTSYIASLKQNVLEEGSMVVRRAGPAKIEFLLNISGDNASQWSFRGETAEHYLPGLNQIDVYDIHKYRDLAQKLMVLGFGISGKELAAGYAISHARRDTVAGRPATAIDLVPKAAEIVDRLHLKKVELWIADSDAAPAREKFYFGADTWTIEYTAIEWNPKLPAGALDLPKGARRVPMK